MLRSIRLSKIIAYPKLKQAKKYKNKIRNRNAFARASARTCGCVGGVCGCGGGYVCVCVRVVKKINRCKYEYIINDDN